MPRQETIAEQAERFEYQNPEWARERTLRLGGYQGPTFFWNMREDGHGWVRVAEVYTTYKAQPEGWPPEIEATYKDGHVTDYWEVVTEDCGKVSVGRQHLGSFSSEELAKKNLIRLQEAQHRARIILAIKELEKVHADPLVVATLKEQMFAYHRQTGPLGG